MPSTPPASTVPSTKIVALRLFRQAFEKSGPPMCGAVVINTKRNGAREGGGCLCVGVRSYVETDEGIRCRDEA